MKVSRGYNERLFRPGTVRARYHNARFHWVAGHIDRLNPVPQSIVELGCFDGKLLDYLTSRPDHYVGYDANWEHGLDIARKKWEGADGIDFRISNFPADIDTTERFDVSVCMDTFEHVASADMESFIDSLSHITRIAILITVPVEKGPIFLLKQVAKSVLKDSRREQYSWQEFLNATACRLDRLSRREHKGFDYGVLIKFVQKKFFEIHVEGIPFPNLPPILNPNVGIIAYKPASE